MRAIAITVCLALGLAVAMGCTTPSPPADGAPELCMSDWACDDGYFCNGAERCEPGNGRTDFFGCLPGEPPCAGACDEARGCVSCTDADADADGEPAAGCGGRDCADTDALVFPGAAEICDLRDQDCDGAVDEDVEGALYLDRDGDGHGDPFRPLGPCTTVPGVTAIGDDCDDGDPSVYPGADELCNGVDDDCRPETDEADASCALFGATSRCVAGRCAVLACDEDLADCNAAATDGCEAALASDPSHCGTCDNACSELGAGLVCSGGRCAVGACPAGEHACGDRCASDVDASACGAECVPCPVPAHGAAICRSGRCSVLCDAGFSGYEDELGIHCVWDRVELTDLRTSTGVLSPPFHPTVTLYEVRVPLETSALSLTALTDPRAALAIEANGETLSAGVASAPIALAPGVTVIEVEVRDARREVTYRLYVRRGELARSTLRAPSPAEAAHFGSTVALDGDRLAVSAEMEVVGVAPDGTSIAGAVHVFERAGAGWDQVAVLPATSNSSFGAVLALEGDMLAVSAPGRRVADADAAGAVMIYRRGTTGWALEAELTSGHPRAHDLFGSALALEAGALAVGAIGDDSGDRGDPDDASAPNAGAVHVFRRLSGAWTREAYLKADAIAAHDRFGTHLALSDGVLAVSGRTRTSIFEELAFTWSARTPVPVARPSGSPPAIALTRTHLFVADPYIPLPEPTVESPWSSMNVGAVHVFRRAGATFTLVDTLWAPNADDGDSFGTWIAAYDDSVLIAATGEESRGTLFDDATPRVGAVYLFRGLGGDRGVWYLKPSSTMHASDRGIALAIEASRALIGLPSDSRSGLEHAGAVFEYPLE